MTLWDKLWRALGGPYPAGTLPDATEAPQPLPSNDPLDRMARGDEPFDEAKALEAWARGVAAGRTLETIERVRRLFAEGAGGERLRVEVARALDARGDEAGALTVLGPVLAAGTSAAAFALAGDAHERRGERVAARRAYERALALDLDHPGVSERLAALRDPSHDEPAPGATLATDGATLGRYRIERQVGRGGAATVFAARDELLGRHVALKVYHRRGPIERVRLATEAKTAAALAHPGVVRVFDLSPELFAIAMELLPSGSVKDLIARRDLDPRGALELMRGLAELLRFVHGRGIVHRDLKPSNFLLRASGQVVLTDFGLALPEGALPERPGEGSMGYMPKEQREGGAADQRSDVHALGVSFREMWPEDVPMPGRLAALIDACMVDAPDVRPSLADLVAELERLTAPAPTEDHPS